MLLSGILTLSSSGCRSSLSWKSKDSWIKKLFVFLLDPNVKRGELYKDYLRLQVD